MEIEGKDDSKILLKKGSKRVFGRGLGFPSDDRTVSRRHVSFELRQDDNQTSPYSRAKVCFEVIGKNPIWVYDSRSGKIEVCRRFERGEMAGGDGFCVSAKRPSWFTLKRKEDGDADEEEKGERLLDNQYEIGETLLRGDEDLGFESLDVSEINPVKEFGFLVMGHEFDHYPKQMIRDIKNWDWFLEEPRKDSKDDEVLEKTRARGVKRKRKIDEGNDDEDWMGESEDDKELIAKLRGVQRSKYSSTRSKDHNIPCKDTSCKSSARKKTIYANEEDNDDGDDDTLGGFIVNDDDMEQQEESSEEEEEEEDFDEDDEEEE